MHSVKTIRLFEDFVNRMDSLFEIRDYDERDFDDLPQTMVAPVYIYTDKPLTLEEIKKHETVRGKLTNRADASDTHSEHIYRITLVKPLYKKKNAWLSLAFDDDDSPAIDKKAFSGYYTYDTTFSELYAQVETADIKAFKEIGGFVKYDKEVPEKPKIELSEETDDFLYSFISGQILHKKATPEIVKELENFKPKVPVKLYKGIEEVQIKHQSEIAPPYKKGMKIDVEIPHLTSWSRNPLIARRFVDEYPSSQPFVVEMVAQPQDMLVDVQMLSKQYYHTNQREIIMKPGKYTYRIVWEGRR